jgi:hypothetical protein
MAMTGQCGFENITSPLRYAWRLVASLRPACHALRRGSSLLALFARCGAARRGAPLFRLRYAPANPSWMFATGTIASARELDWPGECDGETLCGFS